MSVTTQIKQLFFIADLHLSESRPDITECFIHFLHHQIIPHASALYILGDFFETWIGDDDNSALNTRIATELKQVTESNIPIFFIHGNRDFLLGEQFAKRSGLQILPEHHVVTLFGTPTLLLHGDTLCIDDISYQKFRQKVRQPWWQRLVLSLPLWIRKKIAQAAREKSKVKQQQVNPDILDVNQEEVERFFERYEAPLMIHGHTHRPNIHQHMSGTRIVLGDWYTQGSYLTLNEQNYELHRITF